MGVLALLWSVLREQGIVLLSSHIIIAIIYVIAIIWALPILRYQCTKYKVFAAEHKKLVEREKYLPR
jgi:membrane protein YdbS with pleckstrin-like domain